MDYIELTSYLSKPWASVEDIQKIAFCGKNKASIIRDNIISSILKDGKSLPPTKRKIVPTNLVIEYLGLDLNYIYSMAKRQLQIHS